ncbi:hypothetical protein [Thermocoleostomius sinensis]|uniref:Uncharacterized protein n=1 Tax=Thermocoleostomius sinensis A174 TaxID=2016057 RepID=A0A9E8ZD31_9CYAN|nr:hypothetical protein [Thermocoleostomius sinensis]WAL59684.1 hypothetical protein OXH18_21310 [Thermocoleostomius sinensis A174]
MCKQQGWREWWIWAIGLLGLGVIGLSLIGSLMVISPAQAALYCRSTGEHTICILSIKRSAKNYWEYRASVRVDGVERPIELYNCRDRLRTQRDGTTLPFEPAGAGTVICHLFDR